MRKLIVTFLLLFSVPSAADQISLGETFCVHSSSHRVYDDILNYDNLKGVPGAKYEITEIGPLLTMVKSQSKFTQKDAQSSAALVWLVLQPTNLTDGSLYPRFLLNCASIWSDAKNFSHTCSMVGDKEHFGLTAFVSHIQGTEDGCGVGQAKVIYDIKLESSNSDVTAIKTAALAHLGILAPLADKLFDQQLFFKAYFRSLFNGWLNTVQ